MALPLCKSLILLCKLKGKGLQAGRQGSARCGQAHSWGASGGGEAAGARSRAAQRSRPQTLSHAPRHHPPLHDVDIPSVTGECIAQHLQDLRYLGHTGKTASMACKYPGKANSLVRVRSSGQWACSEGVSMTTVVTPAGSCSPASVSSKPSGELPIPRAPVDSMSVGSIT